MLSRLLLSIYALLVSASIAFGQSALTITETPPFTGAAIGAGYNFVNNELYIPTSASLQAIKLPFSISFDAVTPNTPTANSYFITNGVSNSSGLIVIYNTSDPSDNFHFQAVIRPADNGTCDQASSGTMCWRGNYNLNANRHHYCVVWTATRGRFLIDGVKRDETTNVGTFTAATNIWEIGRTFTGGNIFYDMRVYNRALSDDECVYINELQQANLVPNSGSTTLGMIAHWALSDCTNPSGALINCPDTSGNGNNATNDQQPPTVTILTPSAGTATGNVAVTSSCVDPAGLTCEMVCYLLDGTALSLVCPTTSPYTYSWNSANAVDGTRVISAIGFNGVGVPGPSSNSKSMTASNGTSATTYSFDSVAGSDSNNCTSTATACQTITKLQTIVLKGGDTVQFKKGSTFTLSAPYNLCAGDSGCATQNFFPSALTLTFTTYGTGTCNPFALSATGCATFNVASGQSNAINATNPGNVTWTNTAVFGGGVALSSYCLIAGNSPSGTGLHFHSPLIGPNITVQNNWVQDFSCGIGINDTGGTGAMLNFVIEDNVVNGSTNTAAMTQGIRWGPGSQGTVQGNLVFNTGGQPSSNGNGIIGFNYPAPTGGPGSLVQFNVVHDFGANNTSCGGPIGIYATFANNILYQFNEAYRGLPSTYPTSVTGCDWAPFDIDQGSQFITMQYNYAHDSPIASGLELFVLQGNGNDTWNNNIARYNISENNNGVISLAGSAYDNTSYIYNNTGATNLPLVAVGLTNNGNVCWGGGSVGVTYANNLCIYTGTKTTGISYVDTITASPGTVFLNNNYWSTQPLITPYWRYGPLFAGINYMSLGAYQTASSLDANSLNTDPMLAGTAGTGGTCWNSGTSPPARPQPCPSTSVYGLVHGSPMIGAGTDVAALSGSPPADPTVDYWGNPVPNAGPGSGWNIGAFGAAP